MKSNATLLENQNLTDQLTKDSQEKLRNSQTVVSDHELKSKNKPIALVNDLRTRNIPKLVT